MASSTEIPFAYRDFHDVPRAILAPVGAKLLYLSSAFDPTADEYSSSYEVALLRPDVDISGDWSDLSGKVVAALGTIPVAQVRFDPTRRQWLDLASLNLPPGTL